MRNGGIKMYITYELLEEKRACYEGLKWFKEIFPSGCELCKETIAILQMLLQSLFGGSIIMYSRIKRCINCAE